MIEFAKSDVVNNDVIHANTQWAYLIGCRAKLVRVVSCRLPNHTSPTRTTSRQLVGNYLVTSLHA